MILYVQKHLKYTSIWINASIKPLYILFFYNLALKYLLHAATSADAKNNQAFQT